MSRTPFFLFARLGVAQAVSLSLIAGGTGCKETQPFPVASVAASPKTSELGPALTQKLSNAVKARGESYKPRTRHLEADGSPKFTNRLIFESSPYLQQHAHNPVNWMPWGEEAFALAQSLGRPIFLSVGYSTCHWCHVMEEESFEDEEIAALINRLYIPIKVDREERPDVDALYMTAVQLMTGRGGWPMSVWLTPDKLPFFGGTYFPARDGDRGTRQGFMTLLQKHARAFTENPAQVGNRAQALFARMSQGEARPPSQKQIPSAAVSRGVAAAIQRYDERFGGTRRAPKFPSSFPIQLLLRDYATRGDKPSLAMASHTLQQMAAGGIYDHVGGGFHRYSTDARWLVPHFEKMLYDNALLSVAYLEGYQATGNRDFATIARETFDYVLREMTESQGGFYSATDADSLTPSGHREEGYYFTWTPQELAAVLPKDEATLVTEHYQVTPRGNFEGRSILHAKQGRAEAARARRISPEAFDSRLDQALKRLRKARSLRPAPLRDDKVQVSWNGLMLGALARGGTILNEPRYTRAAERAADFLLKALRPKGVLRHSYTAGQVSKTAFLDDYTFFAAGLLDLFEATAKPKYLQAAVELMTTVETQFADSKQGGYFATTKSDGEQLLLRQKPRFDRAIPNGNSYALMAQLRLHALTTNDEWRKRSEALLLAFGADLLQNPMSLDVMLLGLQYKSARDRQIVIVLPEGHRTKPNELAKVLSRTFAPHKVVISGTQQELETGPARQVQWLGSKPARNGLPTAYVCEQGSCQLPTTDPAVFAKQLASIR